MTRDPPDYTTLLSAPFNVIMFRDLINTYY